MSGVSPTVAIVGDGLLAALAALTCAHANGDGRGVTIVGTGRDLPGLGPIGRAVAALPDWSRSPAIAALPLDRLAVAAGGSFSLGIAFTGWSADGGAWFLPFGDTGAPIGAVGFHHLAGRRRAAGRAVRLADYSLAAMAAQTGRFALPSADPRSPLSTLDFAQHFDAVALDTALRRIAARTGTVFAQGAFAAADRDGETIARLTLEDGSVVVADLYLDCTGPDALLIGATLGEAFEPWHDLLPCDSTVSHVAADAAMPPAYAVHAAHRGGWRATLPFAGGLATTDFLLPGSASDLPGNARPFASGLRRRSWRGNCVAIGAAAAQVEPLFGTPLLAAQRALDDLVRLLPARGSSGVEAAEFSRLAIDRAERMRDMAAAIYRTNGRTGDPAWDAARASAPPGPLERKLALFASRGSVPIYDGELFDASDWIVLLDGQGVRPRRIDPLAAAIPDAAIDDHLGRLRERLIAALRTMPTHGEALAALRSTT